MTLFKSVIRHSLRRLGYDIVKCHPGGPRMRADLRFGMNVFGLVVNEFLRTRPGQKLTLLQIGANDGIREDAVRPLLTHANMRAILVEPLPEPFAQLRANCAPLPHVTAVNAAVGETDGTLTLYFLSPGLVEESSLVTSSDRSHVEHWRRIWGLADGATVSLEVPCLTIKTILLQQDMTQVNIAMIDTEGMDPMICHQLLDLPRPPDILHFEYVNSTEAEVRTVLDRLEQMGYAVARSGLDITASSALSIIR